MRACRDRRILAAMARLARFLLALFLVAAVSAPVAAPTAAATTSLTTCTEAAFDSAVAGGGAVQFGIDCTLAMTTAVTIGGGLTVDVEANGHQVILDAGLRTRHFVVSGGSLTLGNLTMRNGQATGATGSGGASGQAGADQTNGTGQNGTDGTPGHAGSPGGDAQGGSMLITSGSMRRERGRLAHRGGMGLAERRARPGNWGRMAPPRFRMRT